MSEEELRENNEVKVSCRGGKPPGNKWKVVLGKDFHIVALEIA